MSCHVVISDYLIERRMAFTLDAADFLAQASRRESSDPLLDTFADHPFFAGCKRWSDLSQTQFHALIINMIKISADHSDTDVADKAHPTMQRLIFFLCCLVRMIEDRSASVLDLLRVYRVSRDDVVYDYTARLEVAFTPPRTSLRVVIDNEGS